MKAVMISIQKPHTDSIFDRKKFIEWRKKPLPKGKYFVYESKTNGGCGKVVGEMEIVGNMYIDLILDISPAIIQQGCVSMEFLTKYANRKEYLYANKIINAKRYDKPKELSEFSVCLKKPLHEDCNDCCFSGTDCIGCGVYKPLIRPPQSWCYVEEKE